MIALIIISLLGFFLYILAAAVSSREDGTSTMLIIFGIILLIFITITIYQVSVSETVVSRIVNAYHNGELIETIHIEGTDTTRTYKYKKQ